MPSIHYWEPQEETYVKHAVRVILCQQSQKGVFLVNGSPATSLDHGVIEIYITYVVCEGHRKALISEVLLNVPRVRGGYVKEGTAPNSSSDRRLSQGEGQREALSLPILWVAGSDRNVAPYIKFP